jgi:hypothetical protein
MGRVIYLFYNEFVAFQADGLLILDYDFIMRIFFDLQKELPNDSLKRSNATLLDHPSRLSVSSLSTKKQKCCSIPQKSRTCKQMNYAQHWQLD